MMSSNGFVISDDLASMKHDAESQQMKNIPKDNGVTPVDLTSTYSLKLSCGYFKTISFSLSLNQVIIPVTETCLSINIWPRL